MSIKFKCSCCDEIIDGMPTFSWKKPMSYFEVPEEERGNVFFTEDLCIIENKCFYVRGCIEIKVSGSEDPFIWGVWVSLSENSFMEFQTLLELNERENFGPYFGWLNASIPMYPETENLKTMVHIRNNGIRPYIELEKTDHPLSLEQQNGITIERVSELYAAIAHRK